MEERERKSMGFGWAGLGWFRLRLKLSLVGKKEEGGRGREVEDCICSPLGMRAHDVGPDFGFF